MSFAKFSLYAEAHIDKLRDFIEAGGNGEIDENSKWKTGEELFQKAQQDGQRMAVIFADAAKDSTGDLLYWALLTSVEVLGERHTRFRFEAMTPISGPVPKSKLIKRSNNEPLSDTYQRSYSIVYTPGFVLDSPPDTRSR